MQPDASDPKPERRPRKKPAKKPGDKLTRRQRRLIQFGESRPPS